MSKTMQSDHLISLSRGQSLQSTCLSLMTGPFMVYIPVYYWLCFSASINIHTFAQGPPSHSLHVLLCNSLLSLSQSHKSIGSDPPPFLYGFFCNRKCFIGCESIVFLFPVTLSRSLNLSLPSNNLFEGNHDGKFDQEKNNRPILYFPNADLIHHKIDAVEKDTLSWFHMKLSLDNKTTYSRM